MNQRHVRRLLSIALITLPIHAGCLIIDNNGGGDGVNNANFVVSEDFSRQITLDDQQRVRLVGINGQVAITGDAGAGTVAIDATRKVGSENTADASAHLPDLQINISVGQHEILIKTEQPEESHGRSYQVDYEITLPDEMSVDLANINGNVSIAGVVSDFGVNLVNGNVVLTDAITMASVTLVNGNIVADVTLRPRADVHMTTVNGNISVTIPRSTSARLSAAVTNGTITVSNLDLTNQTSTNISLTGTLGSGDDDIDLTTVNGTINVAGR